MLRRFLGAAILLPVVGLLVYTVLLNPAAEASPQEVTVITKTSGHEEVKATIVEGQLRISLTNNHRETITAFAFNFADTTIKEDFAYLDVHLGIEPGSTFQKSYPVSSSPIESESPTLNLIAVLLKDGTNDGTAKIAQELEDERLGEKLQVLRTLRILEKEGVLHRDLQAIKSDIVTALNADESQTRLALSDLKPATRSDNKPSDDLMNGLQVGREKMLQRFEVLERLPAEHREKGFIEFKQQANKLFAKL